MQWVKQSLLSLFWILPCLLCPCPTALASQQLSSLCLTPNALSLWDAGLPRVLTWEAPQSQQGLREQPAPPLPLLPTLLPACVRCSIQLLTLWVSDPCMFLQDCCYWEGLKHLHSWTSINLEVKCSPPLSVGIPNLSECLIHYLSIYHLSCIYLILSASSLGLWSTFPLSIWFTASSNLLFSKLNSYISLKEG